LARIITAMAAMMLVQEGRLTLDALAGLKQFRSNEDRRSFQVTREGP
jgi:hypothetical protein